MLELMAGYLMNIVYAHFIFGTVIGLSLILHPSFTERTKGLPMKFRRTAVFGSAFLLGSFIIPMTLRKGFQQRERERQEIWTIYCDDEKMAQGLRYKEAKATAEMMAKLKQMGGEEIDRIRVDYEKATIHIEIKGNEGCD